MAVVADSLADYSRFARATLVLLLKGFAFVRVDPVGQGNFYRRLMSAMDEGLADRGCVYWARLPIDLAG